jgi:hypothetical protein
MWLTSDGTLFGLGASAGWADRDLAVQASAATAFTPLTVTPAMSGRHHDRDQSDGVRLNGGENLDNVAIDAIMTGGAGCAPAGRAASSAVDRWRLGWPGPTGGRGVLTRAVDGLPAWSGRS